MRQPRQEQRQGQRPDQPQHLADLRPRLALQQPADVEQAPQHVRERQPEQPGLSEGINLAVEHISKFAEIEDCKTLVQLTSKILDMKQELEHV